MFLLAPAIQLLQMRSSSANASFMAANSAYAGQSILVVVLPTLDAILGNYQGIVKVRVLTRGVCMLISSIRGELPHAVSSGVALPRTPITVNSPTSVPPVPAAFVAVFSRSSAESGVDGEGRRDLAFVVQGGPTHRDGAPNISRSRLYRISSCWPWLVIARCQSRCSSAATLWWVGNRRCT